MPWVSTAALNRGAQAVARMGGKKRFKANVTHVMTGPADALHGGRDRRRGLNQNHLVKGPDIDAEFERVGGDDGLEVPRLQLRFNFISDFTR